MGQILQADSIGALSHSSGVITLAASRLTIGGQQYVTSSLNRTISTDVTMTANTRYQIFAVVSGGVVSLRISTNENSVGPSGFSSWKLVGSFQSNRLSVFGSFNEINTLAKFVSMIAKTNGAGPGFSPGIANNTLSTVIMQTTSQDTEGNYNAVTGEYIIPITAYYDINFAIRLSGTYSSQGNCEVIMYRNGSPAGFDEVRNESGSSSSFMSTGFNIQGILLNAGDSITFRARPSSWTSVGTVTNTDAHYFAVNLASLSLTRPIKDL